MEQYTVSLRDPLPAGANPAMRATSGHLSVVIDYMTNVHEVAGVRPELRYWQTRLRLGTASPGQIAYFIQRLIDAIEKIPRYQHEEEAERVIASLSVPEAGRYDQQHPLIHWISVTKKLTLTRAAIEATRGLLHYYDIQPKKRRVFWDENTERIEIAKLLDGCLQLNRVIAALPVLRKWRTELEQGRASEEDIKRCLRFVGVMFEYLANYRERDDELKLLV